MALYMFPKLDPEISPDQGDDQASIQELPGAAGTLGSRDELQLDCSGSFPVSPIPMIQRRHWKVERQRSPRTIAAAMGQAEFAVNVNSTV